jgi:hypothetical protein
VDKKVCSICGDELNRGRVAIRKSLGAKMQWPWASDRLFFKSDGGDQGTETVIREGASYEAFMCSGCGSVVVTRAKWSGS